jgi:hypothetical protein
MLVEAGTSPTGAAFTHSAFDTAAFQGTQVLVPGQRGVEYALPSIATGATAAAFLMGATMKQRALPANQSTLPNAHREINATPIADWPPLFSVGNRVEAMDKNGSWYPATVTGITPSGLYRIAWNDGYPLDLIRRVADLRPLAQPVRFCQVSARAHQQQNVELRQLLLAAPVRSKIKFKRRKTPNRSPPRANRAVTEVASLPLASHR